jgi:hypothetical protein
VFDDDPAVLVVGDVDPNLGVDLGLVCRSAAARAAAMSCRLATRLEYKHCHGLPGRQQ